MLAILTALKSMSALFPRITIFQTGIVSFFFTKYTFQDERIMGFSILPSSFELSVNDYKNSVTLIAYGAKNLFLNLRG